MKIVTSPTDAEKSPLPPSPVQFYVAAVIVFNLLDIYLD